MATLRLLIWSVLATLCLCSPYDPLEVEWNLNTNKRATNPLDYSGSWQGHKFTASPDNWRFPFYTLFMDRFVNGDPTNDDANGTVYEHDTTSNQFRHGGDLAGITDSLDYIQGTGIKGIYIAGTPFLNLPWEYDQYSPIDTTILDHHAGTIKQWQAAIEEIHSRGMYVVLDMTGPTMSNYIGFDGYLNSSAPFTPKEHKVQYLQPQWRYLDYSFGNTYNKTCDYPRFWNNSGQLEPERKGSEFSKLVGCYDSDFDQYGDVEAFGLFPDWQRQLAKFGSVQDRLREWHPPVRQRIEHLMCLVISQLDIDGFRFDKGIQITTDPLAEMVRYVRACARRYNKQNFLIVGEITGGNDFGSVYLGRGREPQMRSDNITKSVLFTESDRDRFIRGENLQAFDAAAFHYSIYRTLERFLGLEGNLTSGYDVPSDFVDIWNTFLTTNDFLNANTGQFDPRHMYGTANQDVFRWPAIIDGTDRFLLGQFITTLHMPGIPLLLWGEEQSFYILDSSAANYMFGRQPMSSAQAWQLHGCYRLGTSLFDNWPEGQVVNGCKDDSVSLDHRDPTSPVRNIIRSMYNLREKFPILQDGFGLQSLSNQTHLGKKVPNTTGGRVSIGMWSKVRTSLPGLQDSNTDQSVWLLYQNEPDTKKYEFDCSSNDKALFAPFPDGTTVKNLLAPYDELTLEKGPGKKFFIGGSQQANGCLKELTLDKYGFKAYVPKTSWTGPTAMLSKFVPGHDARLTSRSTVPIELEFTESMDCSTITNSLTLMSKTQGNSNAKIDKSSVSCGAVSNSDVPNYGAYMKSVWRWKGSLTNVSDGIYQLTLTLPISSGSASNTKDHLLFRVGQPDNPMVFPMTANYSYNALTKDSSTKDLTVHHAATGADMWRYSTNWQSSWSGWKQYTGGSSKITELPWSGTSAQRWEGDHVILQYWSKLTGSSDHIQAGDADWSSKSPRRFPHIFAQGPYNQFGYDGGLPTLFGKPKDNGTSDFHLSAEWPTTLQLNVWGIDPDGKPDQGFVYGDYLKNGVLDREIPGSLGGTFLHLNASPPAPHLSYRIEVDEASLNYKVVGAGSRIIQIIVYSLLWAVPVITAGLAIWIYMGAFYKIKFNQIGIPKMGMKGFLGKFKGKRSGFERLANEDEEGLRSLKLSNLHPNNTSRTSLLAATEKDKRRCVLIATMEYDIEDWEIKIKIGGLGVMAQLMGKALGKQDLVWVVPCVGGIDYPIDTLAEPMNVTVMGREYEIQVQYHKLRNITYVLLDAPVFRQQTKSEPYPPRMDDLDSAIYYSAWNACIAETIKRFPVDIYHINDYHGAAAPLYLLPDTIPCCLSLHNAEFQGLWAMRTKEEQEEVCRVYNLSKDTVEKYVQFGEVFNLLHAGASYLRVHQKGFGAVGVSNKYGPRSFARYPIFWGLKEIGKLPNPDPSDTAPWNAEEEANQVIKVDPEFEGARADLRKQAQQWANLNVDPTAELFVFVGRWSVQKGVDLIADIFPAILEKHKKVQLICVGPVIDLHGKFAALKLEEIMKKYPGRVFSKPEFTQLPPYIFSGAEFALIPSRDEPFGLVAVEFGRKGALGVGARVGGLGQMPGWWYTVESTTTKHLIHQFKAAIEDALSSNTEVRALMRARSAKQRFPVAKWVEDLETLQSASIRIHWSQKRDSTALHRRSVSGQGNLAVLGSESRNVSTDRLSIYEEAPAEEEEPSVRVQAGPVTNVSNLGRSLSLGRRTGPGGLRLPIYHSALAEVGEGEGEDDEYEGGEEVEISREEAQAAYQNEPRAPLSVQTGFGRQADRGDGMARGRGRSSERAPLVEIFSPGGSQTPEAPPDYAARDERARSMSRSPSPAARARLLPEDAAPASRSSKRLSSLSLADVTAGRHDYNLQQTELTFTDSTGEYYDRFQEMLRKNLDSKSSETTLAIEDFLQDSEKEWAKKYRAAKLGRARTPSPGADRRHSRASSAGSFDRARNSSSDDGSVYAGSVMDEFLLGHDYVRPSFLKRWMQTRIFDWPVYSIFLALGQILAANSYQIVLLTGGSVVGEAEKIYIIGGIYIVASCLWWLLFRTMSPRWVVSFPFAFYGIGFLIVALAPLIPMGTGRDWARNVAIGLYSFGSASGPLFFALNFGDEGGAPIKTWVYRACLVQGIQQQYVVALFYWGRAMAEMTASGGSVQNAITNKPILAAILGPVAGVLLIIGVLLFTSLPPYYRQTPGKIPSFYKTLFVRRLILWMFVVVILQNYFLSAPYGRNWQYLWSSVYVAPYIIAIMSVVFFVGVWAAILFLFAWLSKSHSWILPIMAFGLLAPRWAQMWWGTSSYGLWLPWVPGGPVAGAIAGRALWLWLGVLDAVQGVGIGMALLQTLTRIHVAVVLIISQLIGAAVTILAKATAPDKDGPGPVFPDLSRGVVQGLIQPWFWVALVCQLAIPVGFFFFFRKEQLSKP